MISEETPKERILLAAKKLFYNQGYSQTGINQILKESNVARASLYLHFGSKEDLGLAYVKAIQKEWFEAFENAISNTSTSQVKILVSFDFLAKNMIINDFKGCRFLNLLADIASISERMRIEIIAHKMALRNTFAALTKEALNDENDTNVSELADTIYLLFEGAITESKVFHDVWPIQTAKKMVEKLIH